MASDDFVYRRHRLRTGTDQVRDGRGRDRLYDVPRFTYVARPVVSSRAGPQRRAFLQQHALDDPYVLANTSAK